MDRRAEPISTRMQDRCPRHKPHSACRASHFGFVDVRRRAIQLGGANREVVPREPVGLDAAHQKWGIFAEEHGFIQGGPATEVFDRPRRGRYARIGERDPPGFEPTRSEDAGVFGEGDDGFAHQSQSDSPQTMRIRARWPRDGLAREPRPIHPRRVVGHDHAASPQRRQGPLDRFDRVGCGNDHGDRRRRCVSIAHSTRSRLRPGPIR